MNNTKIEWCDSTWNPVTGCQHGCEYCYARKIANRFSCETLDAPAELQRIWLKDSKGLTGMHVLRYPVDGFTHNGEMKTEPYPFGFSPTFHKYKLNEPQHWKKPRTVFVCSMADLFGEWVPDSWIEEVFAACEKAPQHRYLFLTKNPQRLCDLANSGKLPERDNFWYGSTVTKPGDKDFWSDRHNSFVSIEPILSGFADVQESLRGINWVIIGAETGNRKDKVIPQKEWIEDICEAAALAKIPVFMKDSLLPIVGEENMRREFPW